MTWDDTQQRRVCRCRAVVARAARRQRRCRRRRLTAPLAVRAPPERAGPQPLSASGCRAGICRSSRSTSTSAAATCSARRRATRRASPAPKLAPVAARQRHAPPRRAGIARRRVAARADRRRRSSRRLDLVVDDGDNPPLDLRGVHGDLRRAAVDLFRVRRHGALRARYGNRVAAGRRATTSKRCATRCASTPSPTRPGASRARVPPTRMPPARRRRCRPSARRSIPTLFRYVRPVPPGDAGLIALPLDARGARAQRGRAPAASPTSGSSTRRRGRCPTWSSACRSRCRSISASSGCSQAPPLARRRSPAKPSVYRIAWPFDAAAVAAPGARPRPRACSSASIVAGVEREPDRRHRDPWFEPARAGGLGARRPGPSGRRRLTLPLPSLDARDLFVIVEEGDNTPLPIDHGACPAAGVSPAFLPRAGSRAAARLRPHRSRAAALRPRAAGAAAAGRRGDRDRGRERGGAALRRHERGPGVAAPLLGVLGVAVLVLSVMIVRLLKKET